jgi:hypothetical protein
MWSVGWVSGLGVTVRFWRVVWEGVWVWLGMVGWGLVGWGMVGWGMKRMVGMVN